jgi:CDP-diacylglycerol--glycerol-3-phosphate 3-phosphatidyltransferase
MAEGASNRVKKSFTDLMRIWFKWFLDPVAGFLNRIGLTPNAVTLLGLAGSIIVAVLLARGELMWAGILMLVMGPVDALDGTMARLRGEASNWGAMVDSVTDRYSELVILGGLLYYFVGQDNSAAVVVTFAAAAGSVLVSYVKARAEGLGFEAKVGILTRVERYLVLAPLLAFRLPVIAVWILAILGNVTALQRIWHVRGQGHALMRQEKGK